MSRPTCLNKRCGVPMAAHEIINHELGDREIWNCPSCGLWLSRPREPFPAGGKLTDFERSLVAHFNCRVFRLHNYCCPEELLEDLVVDGDVVRGAMGQFHAELIGRRPPAGKLN